MFMAFLVLVAGTVFVGLLALSTGFAISTWSHVKNNDVINSGSRVFLDGASCPLGEDRRREAYTVKEAIAYAEQLSIQREHNTNIEDGLFVQDVSFPTCGFKIIKNTFGNEADGK